MPTKFLPQRRAGGPVKCRGEVGRRQTGEGREDRSRDRGKEGLQFPIIGPRSLRTGDGGRETGVVAEPSTVPGPLPWSFPKAWRAYKAKSPVSDPRSEVFIDRRGREDYK